MQQVLRHVVAKMTTPLASAEAARPAKFT